MVRQTAAVLEPTFAKFLLEKCGFDATDDATVALANDQIIKLDYMCDLGFKDFEDLWVRDKDADGNIVPSSIVKLADCNISMLDSTVGTR